MNQTFRVVFNRARGALMVANEVTSSVQKKGTKTMVAVAAAAMMVGSAMAEDAEIVVPKKEAVAVTPSMTVTTPTVAENSAKANTGLFVVYDELAAVVTGNSDFGASAAVGEGAQASYTMKEEGQNQFGLNGGSYSGFTAANGNETAAAGGSIFGVYGASINAKVEGVTFEDNTASRGGVGYVRSDKTFEVTGSTHTNNTSTGSAGVYDLHGLNGSLTATITGSKFEGNKATANAGAIRAEKTALTIKDSEFKNNVATGTEGKNGRGGAIEAINGSKLTVENTTFDGNSAIQGGAVLADNSTLVFTDTTFTNNTAQAWGGAVRFWQDNQTEGSDVTFAVTEGKDIAYVGNKAGQDEALAEKYADMGGLLYMGTAGKVDFAIEKDATLTIGEASATDKTIDSIASGVSGATIEKTGAGKLVINSSTQAFAGGFTVSEGAVEMATGIGEYSIKVASGKEGALDSTFTVKDKASATIQAVNAVAGQGKVTYKAEQGSSLAFNEFNVASGAQSVIEANSAVAIGSLNVKGATPVEEATPTAEENATPLAAGKLTVSGALNLETLNNAGEIVSGAAADLTIGSGSNSGSVFWGSQKQDKVTVAGEFTNSGLMQAKTFVVNGTLNTGMFVTAGDNLSNHVKFDQLDLNAGAKFVITKLPEDQDGTAMAFTDGTINLNGGQFYVGDANTVFTGNVTTDKQANIYINAGSYKYANLTVNGQAEISEGSLTVTGLLGGTGSVVVSDLGTMVLDVTKNFDLTDDGSYAAKDGFNNVEVQDGATLTLAGLTEVTKAQVGQLQKAMSQGSTGILNLGETKISDIEVTDGVVAYNDVSSLGSITTAQLAQTTVSGVTEGGALAGEFAKAVLADQATGLSVGKNQVLVLNGANDMLVKTAEGKAGNVQLAADSIFRTTGANAVIGDVTAAESSNGGLLYVVSGNLTADNVKVNELWVDVGTAFDAKKADIAGGDVYGNVSVQELIVGQGGLNIGSSEENATGHISVETFTSGVMFVDPAWLNDQTLTLNAASTAAIGTLAKAATVEAGQGSVVALGTTDASEATAALSALGINKLGDASAEGNEGLYKAVVYVNGGKTAENAAQTIAGKVYASGHSEADHKASQDTISGVQIGANTLLLINAATVDVEGKTAVFGQNVTLDQGSQTLIANAANGDKVLLSSSVTNNGAIGLTDGDRILGVKLDEGIASVALKNQLGELDHLATIDSIKGLYTDRSLANSKSVQFNKWLMSSDNGLANDAAVVQAGNDVAAIGATAGMASVTLDAMSAFNDTVATRTNILAARGEGVNVWADVNGGRYSAKKLMDGAGYASDIYAGVLGVDAQFAGTVVGAALTVGTGDTDSKNTSAETSMDSDFFGLSVYASHKFGDIFNVAADFGYMQGSNDVSANYNLGSFSADTDAFTLGIRGELLAEVAGFNLVPHVGLRWTQISTDSFEAGYMTDIDDINVFQMPVGITVSGDVKVGGWTASPMFDLSFVPTFGDKNAEMKLGIAGVKASDDLAVRVVDSNPVQATLGVNAVNGAWSFGLDYKLGVGSDDRMNNTFNARLNYAF